jgi:mRNA-degrading endonuclease toxin of MazEF toxin-antitoxin module
MNRQRGAVCWSGDPFKPDPDAGRPWLVVGNDRQPFQDEQSMAVALSTSGHDDALSITEEAWTAGGVPERSHALPWAVHSLRHERIDEQVGALRQSFVDRVVSALYEYVE